MHETNFTTETQRTQSFSKIFFRSHSVVSVVNSNSNSRSFVSIRGCFFGFVRFVALVRRIAVSPIRRFVASLRGPSAVHTEAGPGDRRCCI
jgi:hypothetical protein